MPNKRISKLLKENGFDLSQSVVKKKYFCNSSAFKEYTKESCYYAGLIASDGCISSKDHKENNVLTISLKESDLQTLENLKEFLEYTGKLYYSEKVKCYTLNIIDRELIKGLEDNFNITRGKSLTYIPPILNEELKPYFILGLFDGDGSISCINTVWWSKDENKKFYKRKVYEDKFTFSSSVTGTKETLDYIKDFFGVNLKLQKRYKDDKNNYSLQINDNVQIYNLLSKLYNEDCLKYCMKRKYENFLLLKSQLSKSPLV